MEDRHCGCLFSPIPFANAIPASFESSFFAVFDGHGGQHVADFVRDRLAKNFYMEQAALYTSQENFGNTKNCVGGIEPIESVALRRAFERTELELQKHRFSCLGTGCTASAVVLRRDGLLICANLGDSRAVLCSSNESDSESDDDETNFVALSNDHKPDRPDERKRIIDAGGIVRRSPLFGIFPIGPARAYDANGRWGGLAVSRSFGDYALKHHGEEITGLRNSAAATSSRKKSIVSSVPELRVVQLRRGDSHIVLATDGLWDVVSNVDVGVEASRILSESSESDPGSNDDVTRCEVSESKSASAMALARRLCKIAEERNTSDNITTLVISLQHIPQSATAQNVARVQQVKLHEQYGDDIAIAMSTRN